MMAAPDTDTGHLAVPDLSGVFETTDYYTAYNT